MFITKGFQSTDKQEFKYALGDFAVRQAGLALQKPASDIATYANRSMNFVNMWDASLTHDGFTGFAQRRFQVGYPFVCTH